MRPDTYLSVADDTLLQLLFDAVSEQVCTETRAATAHALTPYAEPDLSRLLQAGMADLEPPEVENIMRADGPERLFEDGVDADRLVFMNKNGENIVANLPFGESAGDRIGGCGVLPDADQVIGLVHALNAYSPARTRTNIDCGDPVPDFGSVSINFDCFAVTADLAFI